MMTEEDPKNNNQVQCRNTIQRIDGGMLETENDVLLAEMVTWITLVR